MQIRAKALKANLGGIYRREERPYDVVNCTFYDVNRGWRKRSAVIS